MRYDETMSDQLIRGHFPEPGFRFAVCQAALTCTEAIRRHQADWLAGWLLSEALTCGILLSVNLKDEEKYTLRWIYPGPVGTILADTNAQAEVRGFPQRLRLLEEVGTLAEAMGGEGRVVAVTSLPNKVLHTGITAGVFQDVPRDLAHLLSLSFQVETALGVGLVMPATDPVTVDSAIGVLVQPLPGADPLAFDQLRGQVEQPDFRAWLEQENPSLEAVLTRITPEGATLEVLEEATPRFSCGCSRSKVTSVLRMLPDEDLREMLEQDGFASVDCHFCATTYRFDQAELEALLARSIAGHG